MSCTEYNVSTSKKQKQVRKKFFDEEEDSIFLEEPSESSEKSAGEESSDNEVVDESNRAMATIQGAWKAISPLNKEDEVMGKWFGVVYCGGKVLMLHVAILLRRFLDDENGPVVSAEMECNMAKVGSGDVLQATPSHFPRDTAIFPLQDVISGPLLVIPEARDSRSYQVQG